VKSKTLSIIKPTPCAEKPHLDSEAKLPLLPVALISRLCLHCAYRLRRWQEDRSPRHDLEISRRWRRRRGDEAGASLHRLDVRIQTCNLVRRIIQRYGDQICPKGRVAAEVNGN